jgi:hypothetical protein
MISYVHHSLNPKSYRVQHEVFPLPSAITVLSLSRERKLQVRTALTNAEGLTESHQSYPHNLNIS